MVPGNFPSLFSSPDTAVKRHNPLQAGSGWTLEMKAGVSKDSLVLLLHFRYIIYPVFTSFSKCKISR
jgi:hypothetical protein